MDHLTLATSLHDQPQVATPRRRRARGTGSKRELRPGVWQLSVTEATTASGKPIRRYQTVYGDAADVADALEALAADVRHDLGDLRVRELIGRYLYANHDPASAAFDRDHAVLHQFIEPAYGDRPAASLDDIDIESALSRVYPDHGPDVTRRALGLTCDAYRWACHQRWTNLDPTRGLTLRTFR